MKNAGLDTLVSYEKGFSAVKVVAIVAIVASIGFSAFIYISSQQKIEQARNQVILYDNKGNVTNGQLVLMNDEIRQFEYKDHIIDAVNWLNQYDEGTIDNNLDKASYYFGDVYNNILQRFDDKKIKAQLQEQNIYTTVTVSSDSVVVDYNQSPYRGQVSFVQNYKKAGIQKTNRLYNTIEFTFEDFVRSNENVHGVKILSWQLINSELLNN